MAEATTKTESQIDPALLPYLTAGLQRAQEIFLTGKQPEFFPGQTYVSPSAATQEAIAQQEAIARAGSPVLQQAQQAYTQAMQGVGQTAGGAFLQGSPYQQAMIEAATRPLTQQFQQQVIPGISSQYSAAGRYGSGAMERALGTASEQFGRALGDVTTNITYQDYARERALQEQARLQQAALAQSAPSIYSQQFIPAQQLAAVGAAQEQIAGLPLQEQLARFQFQQQLPYEQLSGYLSSVYGTPLGRFGTTTTTGTAPSYQNQTMNTIAGAGLGYLGGQALGSFLGGTPMNLSQPSGYGLGGAAIGGLLSFL